MSVLFHSLACTSSWTADIAEEVLNRCVVGHSGFLGQFPLNESEYKITLSFEFFEDFQPPHVSEEDRLVASGYNTVLYFWKCNSHGWQAHSDVTTIDSNCIHQLDLQAVCL